MSDAGFININASTIVLNPSNGGTGVSNPPAHTVPIAEGSSPFNFVGPGIAGQVLQSGGPGADPAFSTPTYPSVSGTSGQVLISDGTNNVYSTATYPLTTTANQLLFSSATNTITGLTSGNNQLAATNSSGVMAMRAFKLNRQVFTSSGTYTPSVGMIYCDIEVVGGGGGSGGCATSGVGHFLASAGGGGGGYAKGTFSSSTIGASQGVVVGAGGLAGVAGNNQGGTGGTTTVGALLAATGGVGGQGAADAAQGGSTGGSGGAGSGGNFQTTGSPGGGSVYTSSFLLSGFGGSSYFGGGAPGVITGSAAQAGTSFGGGGGGGGILASTGQIAGAAGAKGVVIITEYIIN